LLKGDGLTNNLNYEVIIIGGGPAGLSAGLYTSRARLSSLLVEKMETEIPGIFAAGDIRHNSAQQAITAAGDGATAAIYAERFITETDK
jgi:thioredoxin reductase